MRVRGTVGGRIRRLGILAPVALAALLNIASPCGWPDDEWGVSYVGRSADGLSLVAIASGNDRYASIDGGFSWAETAEELPETAREEVAFTYSSRRGETLETNGQTYVVDDPYVISEGEVLYSYGYLQTPGSLWAQGVDKRDSEWNGLPTTEPTSYFYDTQTGHLIMAMGSQGVAVVAADGSTRRVAVGPHAPTDFSLRGKTKILFAAILQTDSSYTNGTALLLAFSLAALAVAGPKAPRRAKEFLIIGAGIAAVAAVAIGVYPGPKAAQYEVFGGLLLLFTGLGALPIFGVVAGLVKARPGVKLMAAILAATLGILVVFLLGALVLFQFGLGFANFLAMGAASLIALVIWWCRYRPDRVSLSTNPPPSTRGSSPSRPSARPPR